MAYFLGNFYLLDCCYSFVNSLYRLTVLLYQIVDSYRVSEHTLCGLGFFLRPYRTYRVLPHAKRDDLSRRTFILQTLFYVDCRDDCIGYYHDSADAKYGEFCCSLSVVIRY